MNNWDIDRIYTFESRGTWYTFTSPDGEGKVFHDSTEHARSETGINSVVHILGTPLDWV